MSDTAEQPEIVVNGRVAERPRLGRKLPAPGRVKRYILTSAQNNTYVHEDVWLNLLALASHYDAEVIVGTYSYQKARYGAKSVKRGSIRHDDYDQLWYDPQILEHIVDEPVQLAPNLVWCGELNILPTSMDPLSQLEAYNGRDSNIVPHAKFAMSSIASLGDEATKLNFTTGTVTQRNYLQKKIGLLSERYHGYGGVLVEVCGDGSWFVRQLEVAEKDWSIRDFDLKAVRGEVTTGNPVEAITWGDVHVRVIDQMTRELAWGPGGMLDTLKPRYQFLHDLIDFRARNHHEAKDPLATFIKWNTRADSVSDEVQEVVDFTRKEASRPWLHTIVVPSNHHEAFLKWLKEAKWQFDPINAKIYHQAWLALLDGEEDIFRWACNERGGLGDNTEFLDTDESCVLAGVECGMHGHLGINGARGNSKNFAKLGRPSTIGHMHSAGIHLGVWTAGTTSLMRIGYNRGPSSWSSSHVVLYPEGTRTMVTFWKGRWRA